MENHNTSIVEAPDPEVRDLMRQPDETSLKVLVSSQIDRAIATARAYPRNLANCIDTITSMATRSAETAAACRYRKPVGGGKFAEGPSIRLAEIIAICWGNIEVGPAAVDIHERHVEAHVSCHDLQRNSRFAGSCMKSIMYSQKGNRAGSRYSDDQIAVTCSAAAAIARRNAITNTVPRVFWEPILERCRQVAAGAIKDLQTTTRKMLEALKAKGIGEDRVLALLTRESAVEITADDIVELQSIGEAVKSGELTLDEAFPMPTTEATAEAKPESRTASVAAKAAEKVKATKPAPEPTPEPAKEQPAPSGDDEPLASEASIEKAMKLWMELDTPAKNKLRKKWQFDTAGEWKTWKTSAVTDLMIDLVEAADEKTK